MPVRTVLLTVALTMGVSMVSGAEGGPDRTRKAPPPRAGTVLGDWGHFLTFGPKIYFNNPDGRAFTFTVHLMRWTFKGGWNTGDFPMRLTTPAGKVILDGVYKVGADAARKFKVSAGAKGVYMLDIGVRQDGSLQWVNCWISCSLGQSVVWTGKPTGNAVRSRRLITQPSVPRRWWFWVPKGTSGFTCRAQRDHQYMTEREDWGISIFSPRGQRMRTMWGQPPISGARPGHEKFKGEMQVKVPVEPGSAGRFWAVEIRLGDSHNYSNINFCLEGVPPYLARSPEEWFNPKTGKAPVIEPYDDSKFMQSVPDKSLKWHQWSPSPALGDGDGVQIRGAASFAIWNPQNRRLWFNVGDYLPRALYEPKKLPYATVSIVNRSGKSIFAGKILMKHHHHHARKPTRLPPTGKGVSTVTVAGVERWLAYTYPATPLVWLGQDAGNGWKRFVYEVGTVRNWYFFVPRGKKSFQVRAAAEHDTDVIDLKVNAPDRTMAAFYGQNGELTVKVPPGLDAKVWHVRTDVGSATRMVTAGPKPRYLGIYLTLDLKGVPGYLAPTWEQWFDPKHPLPAAKRSEKSKRKKYD